MATWDDVRRLALSLPETLERPDGEHSQWRVKDKLFAWMRPLRKADYEALGDSAPAGPILGIRTPGLEAKEALLSEGGAYFATPHFNGYPALLVQLDLIELEDLKEVITEAWATQAPKRLASEYFKKLDAD